MLKALTGKKSRKISHCHNNIKSSLTFANLHNHWMHPGKFPMTFSKTHHEEGFHAYGILDIVKPTPKEPTSLLGTVTNYLCSLVPNGYEEEPELPEEETITLYDPNRPNNNRILEGFPLAKFPHDIQGKFDVTWTDFKAMCMNDRDFGINIACGKKQCEVCERLYETY